MIDCQAASAGAAATAPRPPGRRAGVPVRAGSPRLPTRSPAVAAFFLAPFLVILGLFWYLAIINAVRNSILVFDPAGRPVGVAGAGNYRDILADRSFQHSLLLTASFVAAKVPLQIMFGLGAATLLLRQSRLHAVIRSAIFLPTVIPVVVISLIFAFLFDQQVGIVNSALATVGATERAAWLHEPWRAQLVVLLLSLWQDGGLAMLVFLAGMQAIPRSILEAARLDGAGRWQELRDMTFPLLRRSVQFAAVIGTVAAVQLAAPIRALTQGGPRGATDFAAFHLYEEAFTYFDWGRTSSMAIVLMVGLCLVCGGLLWALRASWEY